MSFITKVFDALDAQKSQPVVSEVGDHGIKSYTGEELLQMVAKARGALRAAGARAGNRVVLLAPNSAAWVAADLAILAEGAATVPLYARQKISELMSVIEDCVPACIVCADAATAAAIREQWDAGAVVPLAQLFEGKAISVPPRERKPHVAASIIYTSGTSGRAKGVMLGAESIDYMLNVTTRSFDRLMKRNAGSERVFHYLPFCFAGSRIMLWSCLCRRVQLFLSTNLERLTAEIKAAQPHCFLNVPVLLERMKQAVESEIAKKPAVIQRIFATAERAYALGRQAPLRERIVCALARATLFRRVVHAISPNLQCLICGSAPLKVEVQRFFGMLGLPVYQVYGLTETTAIVSMDSADETPVPGYVGKPIPECRVKRADNGELCIKGPNVFLGYWGKPKETASMFDADGWFHTGDQAELDDEGRIRIVGRIKDIIVASTGHNVAPEPIERELSERIPEAEHVVVVGHGRPYLTAVISGKVSADAAKRAIDDLNQQLPHYRRIRAYHLTDEQFTEESGLLTINRKIRRQVLEQRFSEEIGRLYG